MADSLEQMQERRKKLIAEIQRRGGKKKAPNFAKQLEELDGQISSYRAEEPRPAEPDNSDNLDAGMDSGGYDDGGVAGGSAERLLGKDARAAKKIAEELMPEGALGRASNQMEDEANAFRAQLQDRMNTASQRSGQMQDVVARMQAGLAGYDSAENQAFREQAQKGIDTQYKTGLGQLARMQARSGVRGASAAAQLTNANRERIAQQKDLEQGLFVKNADEKRSRLEAYGQSLRGMEADEFNRGSQAASMYGQQLGGDRGYATSIEQGNLDRQAAERAGMTDIYFNTIGLGEQRRAQDQAYDLGRRGLRVARQAYK